MDCTTPESTRNTALNLLAYREHSRAELKQKLINHQGQADDVTIVLDQLEKEGLLNDARFAESYITTRARKGFGPVRIRHELAERGINNELITLAFQENNIQWQELAETVRQKKFGQSQAKTFAERSRQLKFLQYRGF